MEVDGRRVLVVGAGRTGAAVARVLARRGGRVLLTDRRPEVQGLSTDEARGGGQITVRLGVDDASLIEGIDLVIPSPGVPANASLLAAATVRGVPILSEIEVAARLLGCPIVAVTGTNGKSTTTTLIGQMMTAAGIRAFVGGNLGTPLIEAVGNDGDPAYDVAVAEVSTFQLEWVEQFRPAVGVLLNVSADHLDRHGTMAAYTALKARLFTAQDASDVALLNREDPIVWGLAPDLRGRVVSFGGPEDDRRVGAFARGRQVVYRDGTAEQAFEPCKPEQAGVVAVENILAAVAAARLRGVPAAAVQAALSAFRGLPHRCELVSESDGVRYYDDSKATNVGAVARALAGIPGRVVLLMGGIDKDADFAPLRSIVREQARAVVAYGRARDRIAKALGGAVPVLCVEHFDAAVARCRQTAEAGDAVLLAPGCASFDQFADYAERGRRFQALVSDAASAGESA